MCSFLPFVFFPHLFHVRLHMLPFLHVANLLFRSLVLPSYLRSLKFSLLDGLVFFSIILSFLLFYKNCAPSNMVENHGVTVSIYILYILNPPNTILHLLALFCSICSSSSPYTMVLFLSIVRLLCRSGTTSSFPFYPYLHSIISYQICEYGF